MTTEQLPPGAYQEGGRLFRKTQRGRPSGTMDVTRQVFLNREEAVARHGDWYNWELGIWCIDGYKLEHDRSTASIMSDPSESTPDPTVTKGARI